MDRPGGEGDGDWVRDRTQWVNRCGGYGFGDDTFAAVEEYIEMTKNDTKNPPIWERYIG